MFLKGLIGVVDLTTLPLAPCPLTAVFGWQGHSSVGTAAVQRFVSTFKAFTG
jgi:hypothetical protein